MIAGRYRIEALLGTGAAASVYRVHDVELDEVVALKLLAERPDAATLDRVRQEVKLARRVTHKNVARTYDLGEHDGARFITLEYVAGRSLRKVLAGGAPELATAFAIAADLCAGLAAIHEAAVIHRDLKPDNILVGDDGSVKVTDFGIALPTAAAVHRLAGGSPGYMAPEQLAGRPLDARSDLYALGIVLYELFTGKPPWEGPFACGEPPRLSQFADVPAELADVLARCLARDREDRPRDVAEVARALPAGRRTALGPQAAPDPRATSLAIAPWTAAEPGDGPLADALGAELVRELSAFATLRVRPFAVARDEAAAAGIDAVIEGDVRRTDDRIHVTLHLLAVRDGLMLWARVIAAANTEILFELADAAAVIARALSADPAPSRPAPPRDAETIGLYLQAVEESRRSFRVLDDRALPLLEKALARSPDDPLLLAALAEQWTRSPGGLGLARRVVEAAERAVQLAPSFIEAHVSLGAVLFVHNDLAGALHPIRRALALSPSCVRAHSMFGTMLCELGRGDAGIAELRSACRLEPRFDIARFSLARQLELRGARAEVDALLADPSPTANGPEDWMHWFLRLRCALARRDPAYTAQLLAAFATSSFARHPLTARLPEIFAPGATVDPIAAPILLLARTQPRPRSRTWLLTFVVELHAFLGDIERAEAQLEVTEADTRFVDLSWIEHCATLADLRGRPRFEAVRDRMRRRAEAWAEAAGV